MIAASLPDRRQVEFGERVVTDQRPSAPSPRVRGEQLDLRFADAEQGSIPACAEETGRRAASSAGSGVHPRVCGGNDREQGSHYAPDGPSPRVRGKLGILEDLFDGIGSIPACAGETNTVSSDPSQSASVMNPANACWKRDWPGSGS